MFTRTHSFSRSLAFYFLSAFLAFSLSRIQAQTEWTLRNPAPCDTPLGGLAFGADHFVAVGNEGAILTSEDGENWVKQLILEGRPNLTRLIFAQSRFVALDTDGGSYTSPDGKTWSKGSKSGGTALSPLVFGKGLFVTIASDHNGFVTSPDGSTWTTRVVGSDVNINSIAFAQDIFVAGTGNANYLTSTDGSTWTSRPVPAKDPLSVYGGKDLFVAVMVHGSAISSDGINWKTSSSRLSQIGFANGTFFATAIGIMKIVSSTDGETWANTGIDYGGLNFQSIVYGAGKYVTFTNRYSTNPANTYENIYYPELSFSADATTWSTRSSFFGPPTSVAYAMGMFVVDDHISSDGTTWSQGGFASQLPPVADYTYPSNDRAYRLSAANNRFFAFEQAYPYRVYMSEDGVTSTLITQTPSHTDRVVFGASHYVIVGGGRILSAPADRPNDFKTVRATSVADVVFAQNRFIAVENDGTIVASIDAENWASSTVLPATAASSSFIEFGNGRFVILRNTGEAFTSTDGDRWIARTTVPFAPSTLTFANGTFVATGAAGSLYTSENGQDWIERPSRSTFEITDVAYGNGQWVGVAKNSGGLIQSAATPGPAAPPVIISSFKNQSFPGEGKPVVIQTVGVTGTGPFSYQWYQDGQLLADQTGPSLTLVLPVVSATESHDYRVVITGAAGSVSSGISTISTVPPIKAWIINQPQDIRANPHQDIQFSVAAAGTGPFTFTWRKNGDPIPNFAPGSNSPSYSSSFAIQDVSPADQGTYDVTISGAGGSVTSLPAKLTLNYARLVNLSARARIGTGENALFAGFVVANHAPKNDRWTILARAAGPSLKSLGVNQPLADPVLDLYQSIGGQQVQQATNDNWSAFTNVPSLLQFSTKVGAFPFTENSRDAALFRQDNERSDPSPQVYSAVVRSAGSESGVALVEFYDASMINTELKNLSARATVGTGEDVLIAGFVVSGNHPLSLLIRGVGPTLADQGVVRFLKDPKLTLFNARGEILQSNDNWSTTASAAQVVGEAARLGAFPLKADSTDAAILVTLDPGLYTVQISSVDGTSGIALAEIYEVN